VTGLHTQAIVFQLPVQTCRWKLRTAERLAGPAFALAFQLPSYRRTVASEHRCLADTSHPVETGSVTRRSQVRTAANCEQRMKQGVNDQLTRSSLFVITTKLRISDSSIYF